MPPIKGKLKQKTSTGSNILHPETEADLVTYSYNSADTQDPKQAANTQQALDRIINAGVGVTDVVDEDGVTLLGSEEANKSIATVTPSAIHAVHEDSVDAANGVAPLDSLRKVPVANLPDFLMGQMIYGGTVNSSGTATLSSNAKAKLGLSSATVALPNTPTDTYEGIYFLGDSTCANSTVKGVASFSVGDWLIAAGSAWKKIDNTDAVTSVNGDVGPVILGGSDIEHDTQADPTKTTVSANINKLASDLATTAATIMVTNGTIGAAGEQSGNAITDISVSGGQIKVTKGQTFLLNSQANVSTTSGSESVTVKGNTLNVVTRNTAQTISGAKTFTNDVTVGNDKKIVATHSTDNYMQLNYSGAVFSNNTENPTAATAQRTILNKTGLHVLRPASGSGASAVQKETAEYQATQILRGDDSNNHYSLILPMKEGTLLVDSDITGKTDKSTLTTKGDIYYASAASTPARLGIGSEGQALTVGSSGVPVWADIPKDIVFKNVQENDVLTQQECDDFVAHKLALVFPQASFPSFYLKTDGNTGNLFGSNITPTAVRYDQNNNYTGGLRHFAFVNPSTRKVGLQASTSSSAFYTSTPTSGSNQLFTAGGAYTALADKADKVSITAGTYSAVSVNSQGIVTAGAQVWKCITSDTPSEKKNITDLATGGLYFIEDGVTLS